MDLSKELRKAGVPMLADDVLVLELSTVSWLQLTDMAGPILDTSLNMSLSSSASGMTSDMTSGMGSGVSAALNGSGTSGSPTLALKHARHGSPSRSGSHGDGDAWANAGLRRDTGVGGEGGTSARGRNPYSGGEGMGQVHSYTQAHVQAHVQAHTLVPGRERDRERFNVSALGDVVKDMRNGGSSMQLELESPSAKSRGGRRRCIGSDDDDYDDNDDNDDDDDDDIGHSNRGAGGVFDKDGLSPLSVHHKFAHIDGDDYVIESSGELDNLDLVMAGESMDAPAARPPKMQVLDRMW